MDLERLEACAEREWDEFLRGCSGALFVHSIAYRNLLVAELGCEPEYLVAREGGEIRGVLPVMWSENAGGGSATPSPITAVTAARWPATRVRPGR